jgi:hypothetical protein
MGPLFQTPEERRYLDLALVPNTRTGSGGINVVFLVEKKNKERFITAHSVKPGKFITLDEEFTVYDKVRIGMFSINFKK